MKFRLSVFIIVVILSQTSYSQNGSKNEPQSDPKKFTGIYPDQGKRELSEEIAAPAADDSGSTSEDCSVSDSSD